MNALRSTIRSHGICTYSAPVQRRYAGNRPMKRTPSSFCCWPAWQARGCSARPVRAITPTWPQHTVQFILPLGPGSGSDIGARLFADRLTARWGQPVVIENRPGGDGFVAITAFLGAHDDHTLLFAPTSTFTAHPILHQKLPYDPHDLMPIARITNTLISISVPASLNASSLDQLVALARREPGRLNRASITGALDLVLSGFLKGTDLEVAGTVPRSGAGGDADLAEGRIRYLHLCLRHRAVAAAGRHHQGAGDDQSNGAPRPRREFRPPPRPAIRSSPSTAWSACSGRPTWRPSCASASPPICGRSRPTPPSSRA